MFYIDSNLFIYASLDRGILGEQSRKIIDLLNRGKIKGITSSLTLDEVIWIVWKEKDRELGIKAGKEIFAIANLDIINVSKKTISSAIELMGKYNLKPRDAIHLSAAIEHGVFTIISEDEDFDKIEEIERLNFVDALKKFRS
ncbi:MAG: type II toxin-antitoxin system VapC family toxin [Candidatus Aenigmarchaeota archaeon]|nr:type II toxin-antitoxin system VapC family toxin [Candidatus Aenigmarchaeota archaeon]